MNQIEAVFPDTYEKYSIDELISVYKQGPVRLKKSAQGLSFEEMKRKVIPGKWSIYEIVIHTTDSEIMGYARFAQTITQSDRKFAFYNQDIWVEKLNYTNYNEEEFYNRLTLFECIRKSVMNLLSNLNVDDWKKTGIHPEIGEITLKNVLELYADHCERHIGQVIERRNIIGKPLDLVGILPERLY